MTYPPPMNVRPARLVRRIVGLHQPVAEVATGFGISVRSAQKWLARESPDRSSTGPKTVLPSGVGTLQTAFRR